MGKDFNKTVWFSSSLCIKQSPCVKLEGKFGVTCSVLMPCEYAFQTSASQPE